MTALHGERGALVLSIDLPTMQPHSRTAGLVDLLKVISGFDVAATWYSPDPAASADVERILAAMPAQEIGILADASWSGREAPRALLMRELTRRVSRAEAAGYSIGTLAMPDQAATEHLDLATKQGIQTLRVRGSVEAPSSLVTRSLARVWGGSQPEVATPRLGRFGLWQVPVSASLPRRERFSLSGAARQGVRGVRAAAERGYFHLTLDAALASDSRVALPRLVERILVEAKARPESRVAVVSVRQLIHRMTVQRRATPAQSILRRRAA